MANRSRLAVPVLVLIAASVAPAITRAAPPRQNAAAIEFFEKKVRPLLVNNCYACHSADTNSQGGLRVDDRNGLIAGGNGGPAVVPGNPQKSRLLLAISYKDGKLKMPPKKQLEEDEVAILTKWIEDGAAWPEVELPSDLGKSEGEYATLRKEHWAWQPLKVVSPPALKDDQWAANDIDGFTLSKLESKGMRPVGDANRGALLRRLTFDLTGLPPTPEQIDAFLADDSPDAVQTVVDRLLASPAFGERWGRHWLDVARFGESTGSSRNVPYPHAWRYRNYVIDAFNADKPYDRFLSEQIAGDLLPYDSPAQHDEQTVATGFLALGVKDVNQRFKVRFVMDNVDEQIDAVTRSVLALTASCARCHDHKFDPIPTADYYALAGIFTSTEICAGVRNKMGGGGLDYYDTDMLLRIGGDVSANPEIAAKIEAKKKELAAARAELAAVRDDPDKSTAGGEADGKLKNARQKVQKIQGEIVGLNDPALAGPVALGVREGKTIADTGIRIRGEAEKIGPVVPRGFLSLIEGAERPAIGSEQSGRRELARWLTDPKNPLTSRVMANRVWQHLFGQGIVTSVDNFGTTGDQPSHPELLDCLADRFVKEGWSVKRLIRTIVLSRTYQLASDATESNLAADPANRLVWRHSPRRLDAEELRDAMLSAAGRLDLSRPTGSAAMDMKVVEMGNNGPEAKRLEGAARASLHRSVYLPLVRLVTPTSLAAFDFAEQGMVTGSRDVTTVAPQALYLLNDPFVRTQSLRLAERALAKNDLDDAARLALAYRLALGRSPTSAESSRGLAYIEQYADLADDPNENGTEPEPADDDDDMPEKKPGKKPMKPPAIPKPATPREAAWASFCQALLASAEFRYAP